MAKKEGELKDLGMAKIARDLAALRGAVVLVGVPSNANPPVDEDGKPLGFSMAQLAATHEFGYPQHGLVARPFMERTKDLNKVQTFKLMSRIYKQVSEGKLSPMQGLTRLGIFYEGCMKDVFRMGNLPALKLATIEKKRSSVPLIDKGHLRASITSKVVPK